MSKSELLGMAKKALSAGDKPSTAITDWIERLTSERFEVDDGLVELIESINLQTTGPTEASRAIRKKLKYGNVHRQLRALTILKALVENCGSRFQTTFANERLVDRIKIMAGDPLTDESVKKRLYSVLLSWREQFKDDPSMRLVGSLYDQLKENRPGYAEAYRKEQERLQGERAAKQEAQRAKLREEEEARQKERDRLKAQSKNKVKRPPFDFQKEKPMIMSTVGQATQCANSLINALQHVNREKESPADNLTVQDYLAKTKLARKQVIRYIQLVENDPTGDFIGTLISTNELIVSAFTLYDQMCKPPEHDSDDEAQVHDADVSAATAAKDVEKRMANLDLGEVDKLQVRQRHAVERAASTRNIHAAAASTSTAHSDLADLDFSVGGSSSALPAPMQPSRADSESFDRGSLSEYSDYDSSEDEASHNARSTSTAATSYRTGTGAGYDRGKGGLLSGGADDEDDGADPFADPEDGVTTPGIVDRPRMEWAQI